MEFRLSAAGPPAALPCALQQSAGYARALRALGADARIVLAQDGGRTLASALVLRRRIGPLRLIWLPRGPVWAPGCDRQARQAVIGGLPGVIGGGGLWLMAPDTGADTALFRHQRLMTPQYVAEIDLTLPAEARLALQHGKWRNRLAHARRRGLRVTRRPFRPRRDGALLARETLQQRSRRYRALPPAFTRAWTEAGRDDTLLFTVSDESGPVAQVLVLLHRPVATYHIGWTGAAGRRVSAHNLALWEAAGWLARKGYARFDLGSVDTEGSPGLARFKIGSGATVRPLGPTCLWLPGLSPRRRAAA